MLNAGLASSLRLFQKCWLHSWTDEVVGQVDNNDPDSLQENDVWEAENNAHAPPVENLHHPNWFLSIC